MELKGKRILLISPEPWAGLHMSKHHLSQALAKAGNSVHFLDPPSALAKDIEVERAGGVNVIRYKHWLRGVNALPRSLHMWYYRRLINRIAARTGGPFDILWCFDTSRMQWFPDGLGYKLLHLADYDILYTGQGLIRTANIILTTARVVKDHVEHLTKAPVINVGHALDDRWMTGIDALTERHVDHVKEVVFMGQLATKYNDWEGFLEIVKRHPELHFRFIGPFEAALPEPAFHALRGLPNVAFLGLKSKDELIPMVRGADLLFFGFRSGIHSKERANPHKVLEYLSTGNVIVGSYTMEYVDRPYLMTTAPEGGDLAEAFDHALSTFAELELPEKRSQRIAIAKGRSMSALLSRIETLIPA